MSLLKRLLTRPSSEARATPQPGTERPDEPAAASVTVPAGHEVTMFQPASAPIVDRLPGGTVIAQLGTSSDEYLEELQQVSEEVDDLLEWYGASPVPIVLAARKFQVSDLFAPNDFDAVALPGLVLWVIDASSSQLWLRNPEPLLQAINRAGTQRMGGSPIQQYVLLTIQQDQVATAGAIEQTLNVLPPPGTADFIRLLASTGVSLGAVPEDGIFFVEVRRPDVVVGGLLMAPLPDLGTAQAAAGPQTVATVARAPRLRRLTLAALEQPGADTRRQLYQELLSRDIALLIIVDRQGRAAPMTWPRFGSALPVFPDITSLLQAADDLHMDRQTLVWAHLQPRDLFAWVDRDLSCGVALNVYKDRNSPLYVPLSQPHVTELARGRIPDAL
jgi:hypothetical protein